MKKFLAMLLALTMVLSLSVTAFAADNEATADAKSENKATIDVTGKYQEGYIYADTVISVDVAWDSMEFTYASKGYQGEWNPGDHSYKNDNSGDWVKKTSDITVTNHSNSAVEASFSFEKIATGITGTFDKESVILATAVGTTKENAPKDTVKFTIGGTMAASDTKLGTITVAIAESDGIEWTSVSTAEQLKAAIATEGSNVKLSNDITTEGYNWSFKENVTLNLNNYTLTIGDSELKASASGITIKNGSIVTERQYTIWIDGGANVNFEDCTLTGKTQSLMANEGVVTLENCTLNKYISVSGANVTVSNCTFNCSAEWITLWDWSTLKCDFNPEDHVKMIDNNTVTNNNDGTWTVRTNGSSDD